jgi:predicted nucleic acid-binding protein
MNTKSEKARLNYIIRTRVNSETANMLCSKASRENLDTATVVREIIAQYFEDNLSDTKIINQNIIQMKRKMTMLENKLEILSMLVLELAKIYTTTFPERKINDDISSKFYEEIIISISNNMKNHKGRLESMVLDIYEQSGEKHEG